MNDILAIVVVGLLSDLLLRELPNHFEAEFDYDGHLHCFKDSSSDAAKPGPTNNTNSKAFSSPEKQLFHNRSFAAETDGSMGR